MGLSTPSGVLQGCRHLWVGVLGGRVAAAEGVRQDPPAGLQMECLKLQCLTLVVLIEYEWSCEEFRSPTTGQRCACRHPAAAPRRHRHTAPKGPPRAWQS